MQRSDKVPVYFAIFRLIRNSGLYNGMMLAINLKWKWFLRVPISPKLLSAVSSFINCKKRRIVWISVILSCRDTNDSDKRDFAVCYLFLLTSGQRLEESKPTPITWPRGWNTAWIRGKHGGWCRTRGRSPAITPSSSGQGWRPLRFLKFNLQNLNDIGEYCLICLSFDNSSTTVLRRIVARSIHLRHHIV